MTNKCTYFGTDLVAALASLDMDDLSHVVDGGLVIEKKTSKRTNTNKSKNKSKFYLHDKDTNTDTNQRMVRLTDGYITLYRARLCSDFIQL